MDGLYVLFYVRNDKQFPYDEVNQALISYYINYEDSRYSLDMDPFRCFYLQLRKAFGHRRYETIGRKAVLERPLADNKRLTKLEIIFLSISKRFAAYELEHGIKMGTKKLPLTGVKDIFNYTKVKALVDLIPADQQHEFRALYFPNFSKHVGLEGKTDTETVIEILKQLQK